MLYLWAGDRRGRVAALYLVRVMAFIDDFTARMRREKDYPRYIIANADKTEFLEVGYSFGSFASYCRWQPSKEQAYIFRTVAEAIVFQDGDGAEFLDDLPFTPLIVRSDSLETIL